MNKFQSIVVATIIALVITGGFLLTGIAIIAHPVAAAPTYIGDYRGHNVICSSILTRVAPRATSKLRSTCQRASFSSMRRDTTNKDKCIVTTFYGRASVYTWGMTFSVSSFSKTSHRCLRPV